MTNYGTIPTSSSPGASAASTSLKYISRAKERIKSGLSTRHPWKLMFDIHSLKLPSSFSEAIGRIKSNTAYFRMNYALIVLGILFVSLLWHPLSMIVLIAMMVAWLFFYFMRDEPLVVVGRTVDDRVVLTVLSVLTLGLLFFTDAVANILYSLLIGAVVVVVHAALRKTDDLFVDEESARLMTSSSSSS